MKKAKKNQRAAERMRYISSPPLFGHFAVWVTVWVKPVPVDFREALFLKNTDIFRGNPAA